MGKPAGLSPGDQPYIPGIFGDELSPATGCCVNPRLVLRPKIWTQNSWFLVNNLALLG
jgi:hypothetical protein